MDITFDAFPAGTAVAVKGTGHFGTVDEITTEGGRPEIMVRIGDMWLGFQPSELEHA